jgi:hypothetical protein
VRRAVWAVAAIAAAVLAGCGGGADGAGAATASPTAAVTTGSLPPPTPPDPPGGAAGLPTDTYGFLAVCRGRTFPGAARYAGAGPHPIEFSNATVEAPDGIVDLDAPAAVLARWETRDVRKVQLVACVTMSKGAPARTCRYAGEPPATLYWRGYRIVLREARTGRQVGPTTRLRGELLQCAELVMANPDGTLDSQFSGISGRQLERVFAAYHSGRAR